MCSPDEVSLPAFLLSERIVLGGLAPEIAVEPRPERVDRGRSTAGKLVEQVRVDVLRSGGPGLLRGAIRAEQHEDINLITLLVGASAEGLQLLNRQKEWLDITAPEGCIVACP